MVWLSSVPGDSQKPPVFTSILAMPCQDLFKWRAVVLEALLRPRRRHGGHLSRSSMAQSCVEHVQWLPWLLFGQGNAEVSPGLISAVHVISRSLGIRPCDALMELVSAIREHRKTASQPMSFSAGVEDAIHGAITDWSKRVPFPPTNDPTTACCPGGSPEDPGAAACNRRRTVGARLGC